MLASVADKGRGQAAKRRRPVILVGEPGRDDHTIRRNDFAIGQRQSKTLFIGLDAPHRSAIHVGYRALLEPVAVSDEIVERQLIGAFGVMFG